MGKITKTKRLKSYYKIYEQIYKDPLIYIAEISDNTGVSRNAVAKYLQEMYADNILTGPSLCLKPHTNYQEYIYFLNFSDPFTVFDGLKEIPDVVSFNNLWRLEHSISDQQIAEFFCITTL